MNREICEGGVTMPIKTQEAGKADLLVSTTMLAHVLQYTHYTQAHIRLVYNGGESA